MVKRFAKMMVVLAAACALVCTALALAGCTKDTTYAAAGTYKLVEIQSDDPEEAMTAEDIAILDAFGLSTTLELRSDGTATWTIVGVPVELTWENTTITLEEETIEFTVSGKTLTLADGGSAMVFEKQ